MPDDSFQMKLLKAIDVASKRRDEIIKVMSISQEYRVLKQDRDFRIINFGSPVTKHLS